MTILKKVRINMGMDVYGKNPKNETGQYFRANVWYWHPLWSYCQEMHPEIANKVENGHDNSGDGLGAKDSVLLAAKLKKDIKTGVAAKYEKDYKEQLDSLPLDDCQYCNGLGVRTWSQENGESITKTCNSCNGDLKVKNFATWYHFSAELLGEFAEFLHYSGGFQIC